MTDISTAVPDAATAHAILELTRSVEAADGAPPLSDQALSHLRSEHAGHTIARVEDRVVGYAQRDGNGAEVVAEAGALTEVVDAVAEPCVLVWSHGRRSRLVPEFERRGWDRERELHQLRRPAADIAADPPLPDGVTVRSFAPGTDDLAWLALNAAAFADHAEQGGMTQADLAARMAESWFDPTGFLLAERAGVLVAFHWTKVHPDGLGEVYVLGVDPDAQGLGLGGALLIRGLHHLQAVGCHTVLLYVDGDNPHALHLYERDGFTRYDLDTQWRMT